MSFRIFNIDKNSSANDGLSGFRIVDQYRNTHQTNDGLEGFRLSNNYKGSDSEIIKHFIQQGNKLVGTGAIGNASQGYSTSLSGDGNTLAIGGANDDSGIGAVWIFVRNINVWSQQAKIVGTGVTGFPSQGHSVSLSADGNTLAVGGSVDSGANGATWIFTRNSNVWSQQGSKLVASDATNPANQGFSVSLSGDGNTLAVGGFEDDNGNGATWIFTRNINVWSQQGLKLVGTGAIGFSGQGFSVSLSGDGNTLAVGGNADDSSNGATWIFTRSGNVWSQQGSKLVGVGASIGGAKQGSSVSLSDDGNTLAVGGYLDSSSIGATWIFTRSGNVWSQQGNKLVGTGFVLSNPHQGWDISLSGDGNTLAVGGYVDNSDAGATWIFIRNANAWSQKDLKLVGTGAIGIAQQGWSVSLSRDGNTLAVGGINDDNNIGATWIFNNQ